MNRKIPLTLLIALFLASCAEAEIPPTPTSTPLPTASPTPNPTVIPATPTETGPRDGETRMKEGVGEQVYEVIRDKEGNVMYAEWVRVKTPGDGIPILDFIRPERYGYNTLGNIQLLCSDRFDSCSSVPKFTHVDKLPENQKDSDLATWALARVYQRFHGLNTGSVPRGEDVYNFLKAHPNGIDFSFFLADPEHPLTWTMSPGPDSSVVEILTDWNDPIPEGGQEFYISTSLTLRSKLLGVDSAGRLIGVVAPNKLPPEGAEYDDWRASVWKAVMFLHSSMVIQQEDLTNIDDTAVLYDMLFASDRKSFQGNPWVIMEPDN